MRSFERLMQLSREDRRYPYEAYVFVFESLTHTQQRLGRGVAVEGESPQDPQRHVNGSELVEGMCELAREQFGLLAPAVFRTWNVRRTDDIGELVFNLIEAELLNKTDSDAREDFRGLFDLDEALRHGYSINLDEVPWLRRVRE